MEKINEVQLNLPTPVLIVISITSILLLLYLSLYAISQETNAYRRSQAASDINEDSYYQGQDETRAAAQENGLRKSSRSDFQRTSQETRDELQRMKTLKDLSGNNRGMFQ